MKTIICLLLLTILAFGQQLNFTWGDQQSGSEYSGNGVVYLDTVSTTSTDIYIDLSDYYWVADIFPQADTSGVNLNSSDRQFLGTFYGYFDTQGTKAPTTDSLKYDIKVYPGVYNSASRPYAGAKFGSAITLENVLQAGDYLSIKSVYVVDAVKVFPPELIKITIDPADGKVPAIDDSVAFYWRFVYPQVYESQKSQINKVD